MKAISKKIYMIFEKILNSINYKNELAIYSLGLIRKIDFYKFYKWKEIEITEGKLGHLIDLEGISIHFFDINDYNYLIDSIITLFFSSLISEIDFVCKILGKLIKFLNDAGKYLYLDNTQKLIKKHLPEHKLSLLFEMEYSRNPKSWLYSMRNIRNDLHHECIKISDIIPEPEITNSYRYEGPFYLNKRYFEEFVEDEDREVIKYCVKVSQKTEWFLSEIFEILSEDLNTNKTVSLF